jgi:hypothetical protein
MRRRRRLRDAEEGGDDATTDVVGWDEISWGFGEEQSELEVSEEESPMFDVKESGEKATSDTSLPWAAGLLLLPPPPLLLLPLWPSPCTAFRFNKDAAAAAAEATHAAVRCAGPDPALARTPGAGGSPAR